MRRWIDRFLAVCWNRRVAKPWIEDGKFKGLYVPLTNRVGSYINGPVGVMALSFDQLKRETRKGEKRVACEHQQEIEIHIGAFI